MDPLKGLTARKLYEHQLRLLTACPKLPSITTDPYACVKEKVRLLIPHFADWCTISVIDEGGYLSCIAAEHRDPSKNPTVRQLALLAAGSPKVASDIYQILQARTTEFYPTLPSDKRSIDRYPAEYIALEKALDSCSIMSIPIKSREEVSGVFTLAYTTSGGNRKYTKDDLEFMECFGQHLALIIENGRLHKEIAERNKNKEIFLATLSHELRNPLGPIKNSLELLKLSNANAKFLEEVQLIEHQFDHITKLLEDLMDINRLIHGKFNINKQPMELSSVITFAVKTTQPMAQKKNIKITTHVPPSPVWVLADAVRIEQALTNLLHNAEKFTDVGGRVDVTLKQGDEMAFIAVSDNGIGIAKEDINKIFELYFQGVKREEAQNDGLGMGLLLVQEVINLHGGTVRAESEGLGHGSTFTVRLPISRHLESIREAPQDPATEQPYYRKILIVDDNPPLADSLSKLLKLIGYETEVSYSANDSISVFERFQPDLALIDLGMPGLDGYALAGILRNDYQVKIPLIALSGYGMEEDKKKAIEAGFNQHLTKPVGLRELKEVFRSYL